MSNDSQKTKVGLAHGLILFDLTNKRVVQIFDGLTFGRVQGNEVFPQDELMSKSHLKVTLKNENVFIEDLGTTNKTRVDGKAIAPKSPIPLALGSTLEFGNQKFILRDSRVSPSRQTVSTAPSTTPHIDPPSQTLNLGAQPVSHPAPERSFVEDLKLFLNPQNWGGSVLAILMLFVLLAFFGQSASERSYFGYRLNNHSQRDNIPFEIEPKKSETTSQSVNSSCEPSYFPVSDKAINLEDRILYLLAGLLAAIVQFMISARAHIRRKSFVKIFVAFFSMIVGSVFLGINNNTDDKATLNSFITSCACPKSTETLPFDYCQQWIENRPSATSRYFTNGKLFTDIPKPGQDAIRASIEQHPLYKISPENRRRLYNAYLKSKEYSRLKDSDRTLETLKVVHEIVPVGIFSSKSLEAAAMDQKAGVPAVPASTK